MRLKGCETCHAIWAEHNGSRRGFVRPVHDSGVCGVCGWCGVIKYDETQHADLYAAFRMGGIDAVVSILAERLPDPRRKE